MRDDIGIICLRRIDKYDALSFHELRDKAGLHIAEISDIHPIMVRTEYQGKLGFRFFLENLRHPAVFQFCKFSHDMCSFAFLYMKNAYGFCVLVEVREKGRPGGTALSKKR